VALLISLDEYLSASYEPDREFVGGLLVKRNVGTMLHGSAQAIVGSHLNEYRKSHGIAVFTSVRVQLDSLQYRVPDLLVLEKPYRQGSFIKDVPLITVEITDPEDTFDW
jgi:Uma2 family endonuclease